MSVYFEMRAQIQMGRDRFTRISLESHESDRLLLLEFAFLPRYLIIFEDFLGN